MVKGLATSHNSAKLLAIPFCQGEVPTNPFVKGMCGPLLAIQKVPHSHIKTGVGVHTPAMGIPPGLNCPALNTPLATLLDHIPPVIKQDLDACPVQSLGLPLPATWFVAKDFATPVAVHPITQEICFLLPVWPRV